MASICPFTLSFRVFLFFLLEASWVLGGQFVRRFLWEGCGDIGGSLYVPCSHMHIGKAFSGLL